MGRLATLLSFARGTISGLPSSLSKLQMGAGHTLSGQHAGSPGDDAHPLEGDYAVSVHVEGSGRLFTVAYIDPKAQHAAQPGDRRLYSRDGQGSMTGEVWLKASGEILLSNSNGSVTLHSDGRVLASNGNGSIDLEAAGDVVINNVTIDTDGKITTPEAVCSPSVVVDGKELRDHMHGGVSSGTDNTGSNL